MACGLVWVAAGLPRPSGHGGLPQPLTLDPDPSRQEAVVRLFCPYALLTVATPGSQGNSLFAANQPQAPALRQPNPDVRRLFPWFIKLFDDQLFCRWIGRVHGVRRLSRLLATRQGIPAIQVPGLERGQQGRGPFLDRQRFWNTGPLMLRALGQIGSRAGQAPRKSQALRARCPGSGSVPIKAPAKRAPRRSAATKEMSREWLPQIGTTEMPPSIEQPRRSIPRRSRVQGTSRTGWHRGDGTEWR